MAGKFYVGLDNALPPLTTKFHNKSYTNNTDFESYQQFHCSPILINVQ